LQEIDGEDAGRDIAATGRAAPIIPACGRAAWPRTD